MPSSFGDLPDVHNIGSLIRKATLTGCNPKPRTATVEFNGKSPQCGECQTNLEKAVSVRSRVDVGTCIPMPLQAHSF